MYAMDGTLVYQEDLKRNKRIYHAYLAGDPVAQVEVDITTGTATNKYLHTDALGSPVAVTNATSGILERTQYEPYGLVINRALRDGPGYTGHVEDAATGLTYMQQRYFDPVIGRFLSVDPVTAYSNPIGAFNRYWYANNNPYRFTDPDGRMPLDPDAEKINLSDAGRGVTSSVRSGQDFGRVDTAPTENVSDAVSKGRISELDSSVQGPAKRFIGEVEQQTGVTLRVVQGLRTVEEQDDLYAQGRTKQGAKVTNAKGGQSFHNYGLAIDVAGVNADGSINWDVDYGAISKIGKSHGFEWGGDFKSIKDKPHFQMTYGYTLEQLQSGEGP